MRHLRRSVVMQAGVSLHATFLSRLCTFLGDAERLAAEVRRLVEDAGGASKCESSARERPAHMSGAALTLREGAVVACDGLTNGRKDWPAVFRRGGDFWIISFEGATVYLRDAKGLHYLAHLLRHPHREFHVLELVAATGGHRECMLVQEGVGPALDARGRLELRTRREDLRAELEEAEQWNDSGRAASLMAELKSIDDYVCASHGLGGRPRPCKLPAEQARQTVTKGVSRARRCIGRHHPALGRHLLASVKTGFVSAYVPEIGGITWQVD